MKTWEMIKELTENPKKVFKVICEESQQETTVSINYGEITTQGYQQLFTDDEWEEVKQPVSFMEAVASEQRLLYINPNDSADARGGYYALDEFLQLLGRTHTDDGVADLILNGEFYIED